MVVAVLEGTAARRAVPTGSGCFVLCRTSRHVENARDLSIFSFTCRTQTFNASHGVSDSVEYDVFVIGMTTHRNRVLDGSDE
jgi:hypothetical protein